MGKAWVESEVECDRLKANIGIIVNLPNASDDIVIELLEFKPLSNSGYQ